jgi:hypothetical protein
MNLYKNYIPEGIIISNRDIDVCSDEGASIDMEDRLADLGYME